MTPSPSRRFDYCLAGTNRLTAVSGFVFNSTVWAQNGQYTNASPQNLAGDSTTASDHCSVFVDYSFPTSVTNFAVTPTNAFVVWTDNRDINPTLNAEEDADATTDPPTLVNGRSRDSNIYFQKIAK